MISETTMNRTEMRRALRDVEEGDRVEFDTEDDLSVSSEVYHATDEYIIVGSHGAPLAVDIERAAAHKWSDESEDSLKSSPSIRIVRLEVTIDPENRRKPSTITQQMPASVRRYGDEDWIAGGRASDEWVHVSELCDECSRNTPTNEI